MKLEYMYIYIYDLHRFLNMANDDPVRAFPGSDLIKLGQNNKKI